VNKVSSPSLVIVSVLLAAFVASVVFYLALSPERNAHTGSSVPQSESTGSR
jgi:chromosome condensin MukBEF MukE localization factor